MNTRRAALRAAFAAAVALVGAATPADPVKQPALKAGVFSPAHPAPELVLQGSDGGALDIRNYRGKVIVLGFGYTSCPDVCPTTLATLAQARRKLGALASDVQVIYVSVDPERDSVERMRRYLTAFDPTFVGGSGAPDRVAAVRESFGVQSEKKLVGDTYVVAHSSSTYLIDRKGLLRALMPYGRGPDDYVHDLRILLEE